jgi:hypothetical protein
MATATLPSSTSSPQFTIASEDDFALRRAYLTPRSFYGFPRNAWSTTKRVLSRAAVCS